MGLAKHLNFISGLGYADNNTTMVYVKERDCGEEMVLC